MLKIIHNKVHVTIYQNQMYIQIVNNFYHPNFMQINEDADIYNVTVNMYHFSLKKKSYIKQQALWVESDVPN